MPFRPAHHGPSRAARRPRLFLAVLAAFVCLIVALLLVPRPGAKGAAGAFPGQSFASQRGTPAPVRPAARPTDKGYTAKPPAGVVAPDGTAATATLEAAGQRATGLAEDWAGSYWCDATGTGASGDPVPPARPDLAAMPWASGASLGPVTEVFCSWALFDPAWDVDGAPFGPRFAADGRVDVPVEVEIAYRADGAFWHVGFVVMLGLGGASDPDQLYGVSWLAFWSTSAPAEAPEWATSPLDGTIPGWAVVSDRMTARVDPGA